MLLEVKLWNKSVGALFFDENSKQIFFEYDKSFVKENLDIAPILMPINSTSKEPYSFIRLPEETFKGLPPVFADSLPDKFGSTVLNAWLEQSGKSINDLNALEKLSYIGIRGLGALEYFPNISMGNRFSEINISEIVQIAKEVLEKKENYQSNFNSIDDIFQIGTSAGGARAKAIIAINNKTNKIVSGDILLEDKDYTYYIIKIDGVKDEQLGVSQGYGKIEYAYYKMAELSGINMMPSKLYEENGREHFLTQRFDRISGEKLHMQTLCGIAGMDYNNLFANSYEQAFTTMSKLNLDYADIEQQYRRMVFNVTGRNLDDHTKNISFLMDKKGRWKLSPAYDITYSYNKDNHWLKQHQMSIGGKRNNITYDDLFKAGKELGIRNRKKIIKEVLNGVSNWQAIANSLNIPDKKIKHIESNLLYKQFSLKT